MQSGAAPCIAVHVGCKMEVVQLRTTCIVLLAAFYTGFGVQPGQVLRLPCIRYKEPRTHADMERFFGPRCTSRYDMEKSGHGGAGALLQGAGAGEGMEMNRQQLASAFGLA